MKNILAIAVATALIAPAAAMAETTLYGNLHASVGTVDTGATSQTLVESHASRFGIKGSTELDNGLSATYGLEYGVGLDGDDAAVLVGRNQFVGVKGGFGEVRLGRHDTQLNSPLPVWMHSVILTVQWKTSLLVTIIV